MKQHVSLTFNLKVELFTELGISRLRMKTKSFSFEAERLYLELILNNFLN